jgi:hypothetical protein
MVDAEHPDGSSIVVDVIDDPVRTAARHPEASELSLEWVPDAARGVDEGSKHELDDRGCDTFGQTSK